MISIYSIDDPRLPLHDTAVALGLFDGAHLGHRAVLDTTVREAKARGLTPCVFTFALADPPRYKQDAAQLSTPPMLARLMDSIGMHYSIGLPFDEVRGESGDEFVRVLLRERLGAKLVCCGYNFGFGKNRAWSASDLERLSGRQHMDCIVAGEVDVDGAPVSSTRIRELIAEGDIPAANALLGRLFSIDFAVVHGNHIGRTLGSPTINQPFPDRFIVPRYGVYATLAYVDGAIYSGVTNVGVKPTVGSDRPLAETYIQGFSGDLYGKEILVSFLRFLRPERRFESLEALRANIRRDADEAAGVAAAYLKNL